MKLDFQKFDHHRAPGNFFRIRVHRGPSFYVNSRRRIPLFHDVVMEMKRIPEKKSGCCWNPEMNPEG